MNQTDGTPRCAEIGLENAPEELDLEPTIKVTGHCTSEGGTLQATVDNYLHAPEDVVWVIAGISKPDGPILVDIPQTSITVAPNNVLRFGWSCAGLSAGVYRVGVQLGTATSSHIDTGFTVDDPPPARSDPVVTTPDPPQPGPTKPAPEAPETTRAPEPRESTTAPKPTPKPSISNFQVVVYHNEPGHVGVSYSVAWDAGRDPVTCHFFIDDVEKFTAQCGTHSSKQFYGIPAGRHTFHATVSDRYGVYSESSPRVTKDVPGQSQPAEKTLSIYNKVTNGSTEMREDSPAYLSTVTRNYCKRDGCAIGGTDMSSGASVTGLCWLWGDRTTNGQDNSTIDDSNPGLYTSTRWYKARHPGGAVGYISEVWIDPSQRGGAGLPAC